MNIYLMLYMSICILLEIDVCCLIKLVFYLNLKIIRSNVKQNK